MKRFAGFSIIVLFIIILFSCGESSTTTGWKYNDKDWGGFEKHDYKGQETAPNLVFIQGGTFTMGQVEKDVRCDANAIPQKMSVTSFYMDETEVSNLAYREYCYWLGRVYLDYQEVRLQAIPDTNCWREKLSYNEPMVKYYYRFPAFDKYPVVGVSWLQATNYAAWRSDRVNEMIMIREGYMRPNPNQIDEDNFNTEAYLAGQYVGDFKKKLKSYSVDAGKEGRNIRLEDGILSPRYRLPTEAEWEYAALAQVGDALFENVNTRRIYAWKGLSMRKDLGRYRGKFLLNMRRGRGDLMGTASELNDASFFTETARSHWPNDYGLYHMSGNVSEWVMDVYRPLSFEDITDYNPFRGNVFTTLERDQDGYLVDKDSLGHLVTRDHTLDENIKKFEEENVDRLNYQKSDNIGFLDEEEFEANEQQYDYGESSLINNKARVYKGGSWNDRAYWQGPGTRRFLDEAQNLSTLGFRCAMIHVGDSKNFSKNF